MDFNNFSFYQQCYFGYVSLYFRDRRCTRFMGWICRALLLCVCVGVYDAECVCVSERYEPWAVAAGQTFAQSATATLNTLKCIDGVFGGSRSEQEG